MKHFGYPHFLDKGEALSSTRSVLSIIVATLKAANHELESSCKRVEDLELSLNEAHECWKRGEDGLRDMCVENLKLSKECAKFVEDNFSIMQVSYENFLQQVELFFQQCTFLESTIVLVGRSLTRNRSLFGTNRPHSFFFVQEDSIKCNICYK